MYSFFKLQNHKGIKKVEISEIGKINVLCGKNNSGKTSILEALNDDKKRAVGIKVQETLIARLTAKCHEVADEYQSPSPSDMNHALPAALNNTLRTGDVLFSDELALLRSKFNDKVNEIIYATTGRRFGHILALDEWITSTTIDFGDNPKTILISPKRTLEHQIKINLGSVKSPDGIGIVNYLFYLKTQRSDSDEYKQYNKIDEAFKEVTNGWEFDIFTDTSNNLTVHFRKESDDWRQSNVCGLGLSDILILLTSTIALESNLVLIEEPESHVHPDMQRRLLRFFKNFEEKQFIITTHSNVFLDNTFVDKVLFCSIDDARVKVADTTSKASMLDDLGYSVVDNLISDLVILVEGPKDVQVLEVFFDRLGLNQYNIRIWPLGGDIMDQVELSVMIENRKCVALIDKDSKSQKVRNRFKKKCETLNIECTQLKRYAMENYFPVRVLKHVFRSDIPDEIKEIDPKKKLEDQIGINVKNNNRKIATAMTIEEIKATGDLYDFILGVKALCEGTE